MNIILRPVAILLGILCAASLLSGAGVAFTDWYAAPKNLSVFLLIISSMCSMVMVCERIFLFLFPKFKNKKEIL